MTGWSRSAGLPSKSRSIGSPPTSTVRSRTRSYVNRMLDQLVEEYPRLYGMILYVEQPFPYELEEHRIDVHSVSARKPLFMDESAHDWHLVRLGRSLGWTGVALKTCKTQTGALLSLCWAPRPRHDPDGSGSEQSDARPGAARAPRAHARTIMGVESNGMQYYPEASLAGGRGSSRSLSPPGWGARPLDVARAGLWLPARRDFQRTSHAGRGRPLDRVTLGKGWRSFYAISLEPVEWFPQGCRHSRSWASTPVGRSRDVTGWSFTSTSPGCGPPPKNKNSPRSGSRYAAEVDHDARCGLLLPGGSLLDRAGGHPSGSHEPFGLSRPRHWGPAARGQFGGRPAPPPQPRARLARKHDRDRAHRRFIAEYLR